VISILYIDDEPALVEIAAHYLKKTQDITVDTAPTITAAWKLLAQHRYDAIISDYSLPDSDGITLLKTLRERNDATPFILFTGRGREEVVIEALNHGAAFYLQKGGDPRAQFAELGHMITQVVERKQTEQALRESEELFRSLVTTMPDATLILDWNGTVLFANEAAFWLVGLDPATPLSAASIIQFVAPEFHEQVLEDLALVRSGTDRFLREYRLITLMGEERWVEGLGTKISFKGGEADLVCLRDITGRKQAEKALRASEERFREVFHNANDGIALNELTEEGLPGRFIEINQTLCSRLLYPREELLSCTPEDLGYSIPKEELQEMIPMLHDRRPVMFETTLRAKNGIRVPMEINSHLCVLDGKTMILSVVRDITERKIMEEVEKKAFGQIERNIDQLAILGDHIRNPLAVIIGFADLLESNTGRKIVEQARIIDRIITQLDMQWIESEKVREFVRRHYRDDVTSLENPLPQASVGDLPHPDTEFDR
jgi:PAS domain S-box-containing protein